MEDSLKKLLTDGVSQIDNSLLDEKLISRLACLYDQISLFNPAYGLVKAEGSEIVIKHILDCLAPVKILKGFISEKTSVADLGSGSGLPGLVLASAFPEKKFTLVERMGRRCQFLRSTSTLMGLNANVEIHESDLSQINEQFDVITFRAFRPVSDIARDLDRITSKNSRICIFKSSEENLNEELVSMENYKAGLFGHSVFDYNVPFLEAKRSLLVFEKNS